MTIVETRLSVLNPDAPLFDPVAFREVEDFSPRWWELVKTSKWFRDFWLSENPEDKFCEADDLDLEEQFDEMIRSSESEDVFETPHAATKLRSGAGTDFKSLLRVLDSPKSRAAWSFHHEPKYNQKPAKHVNSKFRPRRIRQINQPR